MDVVFAVLPFADVGRPAIGVSLLKAEITRRGFSSCIEYLNLDLAEQIGQELYLYLSGSLPSESLVGEWFFADLLFGDQLPHEQEYVARVLALHATDGWIANILKARQVRHDFVERCAGKIRALRARVVGFTTTFHQTCACLAVARLLKEGPDPPLIVFGGANCEGEMGWQLLRSFPWIDYVCTREGDLAFPTLLERLLRDAGPASVPGILRQGDGSELTTPAVVRDLDRLPIPDYHDYFARIAASPLRAAMKPDLLIETSRGCWWGAKQHCTFCGLNGDTMAFRSKSPARVLHELAFLSQTYGVNRIDCVDNILDMRYLDTVFPELRDRGLGLELFYEVKANLRYDQVALLRGSGVHAIQPGIESFSNEVLRLMKKGCTAFQNIQLLRWCEELGLFPAWNLLAGFPGESTAEYDRTAELIPLLTHLQPPASCSPIRLDRFSPLFTRAEQFGLRRLRPTPAYYYVYPLGRRDLARLAYFFDFDYPDGRNPHDYLGAAKRAVDRWWQGRMAQPEHRPRLDALATEDGDVELSDTRPCATRSAYRLTGLAAQVYWRCDSAQRIEGLTRRFGEVADATAIEETLAQLQSDRLMVEMEGQYLSLAVMRRRPAPVAKRGGEDDIHGRETPAPEPLLHLV